MLNEFLPADLQRRRFARSPADQATQLEKARCMKARIEREYDHFPYRD
jgi:hypothetical protein